MKCHMQLNCLPAIFLKILFPLQSPQRFCILEESALNVNDLSHNKRNQPCFNDLHLNNTGRCTCKEAESMDVNAQTRDPRDHINEEPRNDLGDLMNGFFGMATFMTIIFFGMVIIKFIFSE